MNWIIIILCILASVELSLKLRAGLICSKLSEIITKIIHTLTGSAISDHWKEWVLPKYAGRLFLASLQGFGYLLLLLAPFILAFIISKGLGGGFHTLFYSAINLAIISVAALVYAQIRLKYG